MHRAGSQDWVRRGVSWLNDHIGDLNEMILHPLCTALLPIITNSAQSQRRAGQDNFALYAAACQMQKAIVERHGSSLKFIPQILRPIRCYRAATTSLTSHTPQRISASAAAQALLSHLGQLNLKRVGGFLGGGDQTEGFPATSLGKTATGAGVISILTPAASRAR